MFLRLEIYGFLVYGFQFRGYGYAMLSKKAVSARPGCHSKLKGRRTDGQWTP